MAKKAFTQEHTIQASPKAVFAVLSDLDQAREWMPEITAIERIGEGGMAKGTKWVETRTTKRGPFVSTVEVTEYEPATAFALRASNKKVDIHCRFALEPAGDGTKVTMTEGGRLKGLMSLFSGKLVAEMKETDKDLLQRLEAQVTKGGKAKTVPAKGKAPKKAAKPAAKKAAKPAKKSK